MGMRTSGKGSDLTVLAVPLIVLVVVAAAMAGDPGKFVMRVERTLWGVVADVGRWVSALL